MKYVKIHILWGLLLCNLFANSQSIHSDSLFSAGVYKYDIKQYEDAIYLFSLCDSIDKAEIDPTSNRRDYSSMWIASCYYKLGDTLTAKQTSPKYYKFEPIDRRKTIVSDSLSAIAEQFFLLGDDSSALEALIKCSRIEKDSLGEYSIWYYNTIMECGYCCYNLGDYESALFFGEEAYKISNRLFDVDSENYFESVCTLINYHGELGNYDIIVKYLQKLENCIDRNNGDVSIIVNKLSAIAGYYAAIGNCSEYLRIIRKIMDTYDTTTSDVVLLNNLATDLFESGDHESAIKVQTHLVETLTQEPIKDISVYAIGLSNLAYYYSAIGDYPIAVQLCEKASLCFKNNELNPDNITVLNNLANCYYKLGDYENAIQTARNIIPLCLDIHGDNSIEYSTALNNLATYLSHSETHDIHELFSLMDDCIGILENNIDPHDSYFISAICNEGLLFEENGEVRKALQLYNHAAELENEEYQDDYPELALIYYNIASAYDKLNIIDSTLYYLNLSQRIQLNNHMEYTSDYINTLTALFLTYFKNNDIVNMNVCMEKVNESLSNKIKHDFPFVSSSERQKYWLLFCEWYYEILPKSLLLDSSERNRRIVLNSLLLSKGLLLATDISINTHLSEIDSEANQKYVELKQLKSLYDKVLFEPSINSYNVDSLLFSINYLERELVQSSIIIGDDEKQYEIDYKDIQQSLNKDELAVEFFSLPTDSCDVYYAFCIKNTYESPRLMRICSHNDLMQLTKQNTLSLKEISRLIWQPLMEELEDINTVYFSPTGVLTTIPIEYAVMNDTSMSMFDIYNMHRLSSLRELTNRQRASQIQSIALYGGLNYNANSDVIQDDESVINKTIYADRAFVGDERGGVGELVGSRREVNTITQMLPPSISCHLYSNQNGTETSFKALSGDSISIIHISTHGYYWSELLVARKSPKHFQSWNTNMLTDEDLALTRSGLYFAGVNKYLLGEELPSYLDDGVLTALEISKLDLRGTDLVVLSACQTGLGDLKGDGVFGLQRGFKKAGVNSILMSLWKVDDAATELLMVEFYRNYLSGKGKTQSLRDAQKYVREYMDMEGNRIYEHPYYWAGFIMLD